MTSRAELLAALVEERHPAEAIEAERCDLVRPATVRLAEVRRGPVTPDAVTPALIVARRRVLLEIDDAERAARTAHLRRPAAAVEGRAS